MVDLSDKKRMIRLFRPLQAKMTILQINGVPVSSNKGTALITHFEEKRLKFVSHLSLPPIPPIKLGFEIDSAGDGEISFIGWIMTREWKHLHYEYTLQLECSLNEEQRLAKLVSPLMDEMIKAAEKATSSYRKLERDESVEMLDLYI